MKIRTLVAIFGMLVFGALGTSAHAQAMRGWNPAQLQVTRAELEELLKRFETAAGSDAYSRDLRLRAKSEADLVRARLSEGDFQIGDQIALSVEGQPELTATFVVTPSRTLALPLIGDVSLQGVLRSELESHLEGQLSRFIRSPVVRAQSLIRISVTGTVGKPGFYLIPTEQLLTDALMMAGGPGGRADLKKIMIERGDRRIWQGEALQQAITEGRTLDQLSLRAGDRLVVPAERQAGRGPLLTALGVTSTVVMLAFRISRLL
jgi:protein involved in polysaccharide export with SLBB domain